MDNKQSTNKPITSGINGYDNDEKGLGGAFVVINSGDLSGQEVTNRSLNDRLLIVESQNSELAFNVNVLQDRLNQQTACLSIVQQRNVQLKKSLAEVTELNAVYKQKLDAIYKSYNDAIQESKRRLQEVQENAFDITKYKKLPVVPKPFNYEELGSSPPESPRENGDVGIFDHEDFSILSDSPLQDGESKKSDEEDKKHRNGVHPDEDEEKSPRDSLEGGISTRDKSQPDAGTIVKMPLTGQEDELGLSNEDDLPDSQDSTPRLGGVSPTSSVTKAQVGPRKPHDRGTTPTK